GLMIPCDFQLPDGGLFPGAGRACPWEARIALKLWRRSGPSPSAGECADVGIRAVMLHLQNLQAFIHQLVPKCPGRTLARKRQVLARMQRVRMFMEGNTDRSVRLAELAELSRFSEWWVSKTYRAIYGETVQETSIRLRMERARNLLESTS